MLIDFVCERSCFFFYSKTLSPEDGFLVIFEQLKTFLNYQLTRSRYATTDWEDDEVSEQRGRRSETSFWSEQEEGRASGRAEAERDNTVELFYALSIMSCVYNYFSIPMCVCMWMTIPFNYTNSLYSLRAAVHYMIYVTSLPVWLLFMACWASLLCIVSWWRQ